MKKVNLASLKRINSWARKLHCHLEKRTSIKSFEFSTVHCILNSPQSIIQHLSDVHSFFTALSSSTALLQNTSTTRQTDSKAKSGGNKTTRKKSNKTTVKPAPKRAIATSSSLSRQIVPTQSSNRIQLSTKEIPPSKRPTKSKKLKEPLNYDNDLYQCPNATQAEFQLFPTLCKRHGECIKNVGKTYRCCKQFGSRRCLRGIAKPIPEQDHARKWETINCTTIRLI